MGHIFILHMALKGWRNGLRLYCQAGKYQHISIHKTLRYSYKNFDYFPPLHLVKDRSLGRPVHQRLHHAALYECDEDPSGAGYIPS